MQKPVRDKQGSAIKLDDITCVDQRVEMNTLYDEVAQKTFPHIHNSVIVSKHI